MQNESERIKWFGSPPSKPEPGMWAKLKAVIEQSGNNPFPIKGIPEPRIVIPEEPIKIIGFGMMNTELDMSKFINPNL